MFSPICLFLTYVICCEEIKSGINVCSKIFHKILLLNHRYLVILHAFQESYKSFSVKSSSQSFDLFSESFGTFNFCHSFLFAFSKRVWSVIFLSSTMNFFIVFELLVVFLHSKRILLIFCYVHTSRICF